ncbi:MAG: hypothetical protein HYV06_07000 [Deltaproteobacteria bacterium]|nr:hypothetical protein [Deltaproteobacteria bacterium]
MIVRNAAPRRSLAVALLWALLLLAPLTALADPLYLVRTAAEVPSQPSPLKNGSKRPVVVALDNKGDMVICCPYFNVTLAYAPPEDTLKPQERMNVAMMRENPAINGISMRFSFAF